MCIVFYYVLYIYILQIVSNHYPNSHWTGTARMGNTLTDLHTNDLGTGTSVVDEKLKVRGTSNLYTAG